MTWRGGRLRVALGLAGLFALTVPFLAWDVRVAGGRASLQWNPVGLVDFYRGLVPVFGFVALLIALEQAARAGWLGFVEPVRAWVRRASSHRWFYPVLLAVAVVGSLFLPDKMATWAAMTALFMIQALGLNITVGMAGLLVLGYAAFFAAGGYAFAVAHQFLPWVTWWMALPLACGVSAALGWLVGLPCIRMRGDYLALVTLGFAEALRELLRNLEVTGGDMGLGVAPGARVGGCFGFGQVQVWCAVCVVALGLAVFCVHRVYHSRVGRAWIAIREDEVAAGAMGISVVKLKLLAFVMSAAFAGAAGALYVANAGFISPAEAEFGQSVLVLAMVILGGLGSIPGALLGAALLYLFQALVRDQLPWLADYRLPLFGALMVAVMLYRPQGLIGSQRHRHELEGS